MMIKRKSSNWICQWNSVSGFLFQVLYIPKCWGKPCICFFLKPVLQHRGLNQENYAKMNITLWMKTSIYEYEHYEHKIGIDKVHSASFGSKQQEWTQQKQPNWPNFIMPKQHRHQLPLGHMFAPMMPAFITTSSEKSWEKWMSSEWFMISLGPNGHHVSGQISPKSQGYQAKKPKFGLRHPWKISFLGEYLKAQQLMS